MILERAKSASNDDGYFELYAVEGLRWFRLLSDPEFSAPVPEPVTDPDPTILSYSIF